MHFEPMKQKARFARGANSTRDFAATLLLLPRSKMYYLSLGQLFYLFCSLLFPDQKSCWAQSSKFHSFHARERVINAKISSQKLHYTSDSVITSS